MVADAQLINI